MNRDATSYAERHQAGHHRVGISVLLGDHLAMIVGGYAPHVVVHCRKDWDRLASDIDAREYSCTLRNAGQGLVGYCGIEVIEVQVNVIFFLAGAPALADFDRHSAGCATARSQMLRRWR